MFAPLPELSEFFKRMLEVTTDAVVADYLLWLTPILIITLILAHHPLALTLTLIG